MPPKLSYGPSLVSSDAVIQLSSKCKTSEGDAPKLLTPVISAQNSGRGKSDLVGQKGEKHLNTFKPCSGIETWSCCEQ